MKSGCWICCTWPKATAITPFVYIRNDDDVQRLVTGLFKATTPKGSQTQDPFWDNSAAMLLKAILFYLYHEAPPEEQNFSMVMEMLRAGAVNEEDSSYQSPLDILFARLEMRSPLHIAVKYYRDYRGGAAKTLKSIQITPGGPAGKVQPVQCRISDHDR